jgi:hypothetical protein
MFYKLENKPPSPETESGKFLRQGIGCNKLLDLVKRFKPKEKENQENILKKELTSWSEKIFLDDFNQRRRDVDVFQHSHFQRNMTEYIGMLARCALPRLEREDRLGTIDLTDRVKKIVLLGIGKPDESFVTEIGKALIDLGYKLDKDDVLITGDPSSIYLFTACYAFPLPSVKPTISSHCDSAYSTFYTKLVGASVVNKAYQIPLHIDQRWDGIFPPLRVLTEDEARQLIEIHECLLLGVILKVIEIKEDERGRLTYGYTREARPYSVFQPLGSKKIAIEKLKIETELKGQILNEIRNRENGMESSQRLAEIYYWAVCYLSEEYSENTPEKSVLQRKLNSLIHSISVLKKPEFSLDNYREELKNKRRTDDEIRDKVLGEIRKRLGDDVIWIKGFPVIKDLSLWKLKDAKESI